MKSTLWLCLLLGFFLGIFIHKIYRATCVKRKLNAAGELESDSEDYTDDYIWVRNGPLAVIREDDLFKEYPDFTDLKMVLVVNSKLKMGKGKIGAQCGHASLGSYSRAVKLADGSKYWQKLLELYQRTGKKKVCAKVLNVDELIEVHKKATSLGIPNYLVADAGLTQIAAGSLTVCGIGPADAAMID